MNITRKLLVLVACLLAACASPADPPDAVSSAAALTMTDTPAAGESGQIQFNQGGVLAADPALSYDPASGNLLLGSGATASQGGIVIGRGSTATGPLSTTIGYSSKSVQTYSISIGPYNTSSGAASVAIGEVLTSSGANSVAIGYASQATGTYSSAIGCYNGATATGAIALGMSAWAIRPGELAHSSGISGNSGLRAIDLAATSNDGSPVNLVNYEGGELLMSAMSVDSMRIRLSVATLDGTHRHAHEVVEALISVTNAYQVTVESVEHVAGNLEALGMSLEVAPLPYSLLRIRVNPNGIPARLLARVEWSDMGNAP